MQKKKKKQKRYRDRKKAREGDSYLKKECSRVKRYYVPTTELAPKALAKSFKWPDKLDTVWITADAILMAVDEPLRIGKTRNLFNSDRKKLTPLSSCLVYKK